jgi:hypothetical protein
MTTVDVLPPSTVIEGAFTTVGYCVGAVTAAAPPPTAAFWALEGWMRARRRRRSVVRRGKEREERDGCVERGRIVVVCFEEVCFGVEVVVERRALVE